MLGALDRELRLMREAGEQRKLTIVELAVADRGGQRGDAIAFEPERRDDDACDAHLGGDRHRLDVLRLEHERIGALEPLVRELARRTAVGPTGSSSRVKPNDARATRSRGSASSSIQSAARRVPSTRAVTSALRPSTSSGDSAVASSRLASSSAFAISAASSCFQ